jgi:hypothetical protein
MQYSCMNTCFLRFYVKELRKKSGLCEQTRFLLTVYFTNIIFLVSTKLRAVIW